MHGRSGLLRITLIVITAAGLAIDAYVHFHLASAFKHNKTSTLSETDLFRLEAVLAVIAAVALVLRPRRLTAGFAFLVAAAGFAAVLVYRYVDIGAFGPIPGMYDPYWLPAEKIVSAVAEGVAAVTALWLVWLYSARADRTAGVTRPSRHTTALPNG